MLTTALQGRSCNCARFIDKDTEAQRNSACPETQSKAAGSMFGRVVALAIEREVFMVVGSGLPSVKWVYWSSCYLPPRTV